MAHHFTVEERVILYGLLKRKTPRKNIAEIMQRDRSTIYREIKRNSGLRGYRPKQAQRKAEQRRLKSRRTCKMADDRIYAYVTDKLTKLWSPDQIAGRVRLDFPRQRDLWISRQTIYNWIWPRKRRWRRMLRLCGRRRRSDRRGQLRECVRIDGRPKIIDSRRRFGDWEGDTVVGKGHRSAIVTMVERKSGYAKIGKLKGLHSAPVIQLAAGRLKRLPKDLRRSMTLDNGREFSQHKKLTVRTGIEVYFAEPYAAWQRGTNENTNGLLRQFFPKGTDFTRISHHEVARVEKLLNERPRRRLGYRTPREVLAPKLRCI
jgi:transposase, IS30 family